MSDIQFKKECPKLDSSSTVFHFIPFFYRDSRNTYFDTTYEEKYLLREFCKEIEHRCEHPDEKFQARANSFLMYYGIQSKPKIAYTVDIHFRTFIHIFLTLIAEDESARKDWIDTDDDNIIKSRMKDIINKFKEYGSGELKSSMFSDILEKYKTHQNLLKEILQECDITN